MVGCTPGTDDDAGQGMAKWGVPAVLPLQVRPPRATLSNGAAQPRLSEPLEQALLSAFAAIGLPLVVVGRDARGETEIEWCSQGCRRLIGLPEESESNGVRDSQPVLFGLSREVVNAALAGRDLSGNSSFRYESTLPTLAGDALPVEIATVALGPNQDRWVAMLDDQRASRAAEAALRRSEERLEKLVESIAESVWIFRGRSVIYANPAAASLLGFSCAELIGMDVGQLCEASDVEPFLQHLARAARGEASHPHDTRILTRDRRQLVLEMSSVLLDHDGEVTVLSFGRNVTERKRAESSLLQTDRLAALGMLAAGMAHALNNPLTYVLLNLDQIARELPFVAGEQPALADVIARLLEAREGAERMAGVVKRMRSLARAEESEPRPVSLRHVLESVIDLVGHEVQHRGRLTTRFEDVPLINADESRIEQVCLGLLLFAARMLPETEGETHEVRLSLELDNRKFAVVEVVCEGCPLAAAEVEHLFDPFASNPEARSAGFGLSVCSSLVEQLGGQIEAEHLPGTGLLLRLGIPCSPAAPLLEAPSSSSREPSLLPSVAERARLLVVDDDPGVGRALRLMLEDEHDVVCFVRPREALHALLEDSSFDLVFCDVMMPELSGIDIYEVLRFNRPGYESRIVFMTGGAFTPDAKRFLGRVSNQRIEKPFNLRVLQRLVRRAKVGRGA